VEAGGAGRQPRKAPSCSQAPLARCGSAQRLSSADLGSSCLSCNANTPPHAGISTAKITWRDGEATLSDTGQEGQAHRGERGLNICCTSGMGELAQSDRLG